MNYANISLLVDQQILAITLNRPEKLNALNEQTLLELSSAFDDAAQDQDIRVVTITGAGDKAFVAGADISEIQALSPLRAREFSLLGQQLMLQIQNLGKPVIAGINGYALGGGCELALACSLRIASSSALLGLPEITLGLIPGFGGTQRLTRLVGSTRALEMALTGKPITADTALQYGILNKVVAAEELTAELNQWAVKLSRAAPHAMAGILDCINKGPELPLEAALENESDRFALCCTTEDMREGTSAFLEKRKAQFRGH